MRTKVINKENNWDGVWRTRNGLFAKIDKGIGINQFNEPLMIDDNGNCINLGENWDLMERLQTESKLYARVKEMFL